MKAFTRIELVGFLLAGPWIISQGDINERIKDQDYCVVPIFNGGDDDFELFSISELED